MKEEASRLFTFNSQSSDHEFEFYGIRESFEVFELKIYVCRFAASQDPPQALGIQSSHPEELSHKNQSAIR
jgi:hypothetical protein